LQGPLSRAGEIYNYAEIVIWSTLGVVTYARTRRASNPARRQGRIAAVTLLLFGLSDYAEARTGGEWWHPPWLLAWKAACVLVLFALLLLAYRRQRRERGQVPTAPP
jgi:hypothetical protein